VTAGGLTIEDLEHWRLFGAGCRVVELTADHARFELCACTGELVERHESRDPRLIAYLRTVPPPPDDASE
jgi:hypothetical protein